MKYNRGTIYLVGTIFSLSIALMSYINSSFISSFIDEKLVGVIYALGSAVSIIALLVAPAIFRRIGGYKFLLWIIALNCLGIFLFAFAQNALSAIPLFVFGFTLNILIYFSLDELLKIFSRESAIGKTRGAYTALCSLAWVVAQLALGTFLGETSFRIIYLISFAIMLVFFIVSYLRLRAIPDPKYDHTNTIRYIREFIKNKNLFRAYGISFLLQFFYSWMVIYTPIYLYVHIGFSWKEIGLIFAIMLLPFVLIPLELGEYSDKIGERKTLMVGFTITALTTLLLFIINSHQAWVWAALLFATRVGAASIEVMVDTYFFKHIRPENEEFIGVYRSASPVAYIVGPLLALVVFSFIPSFNYIFLVLGAITLSGVYIASTIKKGDI